MFSVERFGFSVPPSGEEQGNSEANDRKRKNDAVNDLLEKSKKRIQKDQESKLKKPSLQNKPNGSQDLKMKEKKISMESSIASLKGQQLTSALRKSETDEERKQRKAAAKLAKKERKAKMRQDQSDNGELVAKSSETIAATTGDNGTVNTSSEPIHATGPPEPSPNKNEGFASVLRQLDPTRAKQLELPKPQPNERDGDQLEDFSNQPNTDEGNNQLISVESSKFEPVGIEESIEAWGIDEELARALNDEGIFSYFPVQAAVIPLLLQSSRLPFIQPRDICVSAPTGSGKTLSYALPIVQCLKSRKVKRLRALVLLPSRELSSQVYQIFTKLTQNTDLSIVLATGHHLLETEKPLLVDSTGICKVDILVCTPGRLLDHIQSTNGFTLEHCQYLVLDEADRLLSNAYDHWVRSLIKNTGEIPSAQSSRNLYQQSFFSAPAADVLSIDEASINCLKLTMCNNGGKTPLPRRKFLQRLLFSATLTDNPRKLSLLGIHNPLIIRASALPSSNKVDEFGKSNSTTSIDSISNSTGYVLPASLTEAILVCETGDRPKTLIALIHDTVEKSVDDSSDANQIDCGVILIFVSSVESAHRLCRLLQIYNGQLQADDMVNDKDNAVDKSGHACSELKFRGDVREMTRLVYANARSLVMEDARQGRVRVIVSSDQLSRGIDLPNVTLVVNYDPPKHPRTYVHRVGRTARANKSGHSITILKGGQVGEFKKLRKAIDSNFESVSKCKVSKRLVDKCQHQYEIALEKLETIIDAEDSAILDRGQY